jgi:hypothetical protein
MTSLPNDVRYFDFCYPFSAISVSSAVNSFWLRPCRAVTSVAKEFGKLNIGDYLGFGAWNFKFCFRLCGELFFGGNVERAKDAHQVYIRQVGPFAFMPDL